MFIMIRDKISGKDLNVNTSRIITYTADELKLSISYKLVNNILLEEEFTSLTDLTDKLNSLKEIKES